MPGAFSGSGGDALCDGGFRQRAGEPPLAGGISPRDGKRCGDELHGGHKNAPGRAGGGKAAALPAGGAAAAGRKADSENFRPGREEPARPGLSDDFGNPSGSGQFGHDPAGGRGRRNHRSGDEPGYRGHLQSQGDPFHHGLHSPGALCVCG